MEKGQNTMTEMIINLTLEIMYLLSGEDYTVLKKSSGSNPPASDRSHLTASPPHSLTHDQKILELTNKIVHLLTGEVWQHIQGKKEHYKNLIAAKEPPVRSLDSSASHDGFPNHVYSSDCSDEDQSVTEDNSGSKYSEACDNIRLPLDNSDQNEDFSEEENIADVYTQHPCASVKEELILCEEKLTDIYTPHPSSDTRKPVLHEERNLTDTHIPPHRDLTQCPSTPVHPKSFSEDIMDPSVYIHADGTPTTSTHIKKEVASAKERNLTHADMYAPRDISTQYTSDHIKEESVSCKENLPHTHHSSLADQPLYISTPAKEHVSYEDGHLTDSVIYTPTYPNPYTSTHISSGSVSYEGTNLVNTDIYTPTDHAQSRNAYTKNKEASPTDSYMYPQVKYTQHLLHNAGDSGKLDNNKSRGSKKVTAKFTGYNKALNETSQSPQTPQRPYTCSECPNTFTSKSDLHMHQMLHRRPPSLICSECGKSFVSKTNLAKHQGIHTGEKPYSCTDCGKRFREKHCLQLHQKVHTRENLFRCSDCGKCFLQKSDLSVHQRVHTGEKPFACLQCDKRFTQKIQLTRHQTIHTGEKPFSCPECGKSFRLKNMLHNHIKTHK